MLVFDRSSLFNRALTACGNLRVRHPDNVTIKSVISQVQYLLDLETGKTRDRSRLDTVVVGVLARCEIEYLDPKTAKLLQKVAEEARKMETPTPEASPMFARKEPAHPAATPVPTPVPTPAEAAAEAAPPPSAPAPAAASPGASSPARSARPAAAPAKSASYLGGDLALVGTLSGGGDVHLGGRFEGEVRVRDATVGAGGRVEGTITGRRIEVLGRVRGGLVADEVLVRTNAQVDGDVTSDSFGLDAGARFEGSSRRSAR